MENHVVLMTELNYISGVGVGCEGGGTRYLSGKHMSPKIWVEGYFFSKRVVLLRSLN